MCTESDDVIEEDASYTTSVLKMLKILKITVSTK